MNPLETTSQIAEILTAIIAIGASLVYGIGRNIRRHALERYLRSEMDMNPRRYGAGDHGRRSTMHLVAALRMPEDEILRAAFRSKKITVLPATGPGITRADAIYLEAN